MEASAGASSSQSEEPQSQKNASSGIDASVEHDNQERKEVAEEAGRYQSEGSQNFSSGRPRLFLSQGSSNEGGGVMVRATTVMKELVAVHDYIEGIKRGQARDFIYSTKADVLFGLVICLNTVFIGIDVNIHAEYGDDGTFPSWLWIAESLFLLAFCIEITLRLKADGFKKFFETFWGLFDSAVTGLGVIDTWVITPYYALNSEGGGSAQSSMSVLTVLRIFRILRLVRVVRLLRVFKELVLLIRTLGEALKAVAWMGLLLMVVIFVGAVFCTVLLSPGPKPEGEEEAGQAAKRVYFGTLSQSIYSHWILLITEGWIEIAQVAIDADGWWWSFYFILFIMITNFALLNMVVAVITEKILQLDQEDLPFEQLQEELKQFRQCLEGVFLLADVDACGCLSPDELRRIFEDRQLRRVLEAFEVNCAMPFEYLWPIIDWNADGSVTFDEFVQACLRLRGSKGKHNFQVLILQSDIQKGMHSVRKRLADIEDRVQRAEVASETRWSRVEALLQREHTLLFAACADQEPSAGPLGTLELVDPEEIWKTESKSNLEAPPEVGGESPEVSGGDSKVAVDSLQKTVLVNALGGLQPA